MYDRIIKVINDGYEYNISLLCAFLIDSTKCIIYTKGERDYNNNMIIYIAKINDFDGKQYISNIDYDTKEKVKEILRQMIKYNSEVK